MTTTPSKAPNAKRRDDDVRGAPKGKFGNTAFIPTDEQRAKVRTYAKTFPHHSRHLIARLMGFSVMTLDRHFGDDMELGRAEMLATIGAQMINRAMDAGKSDLAKGDQDAQKFILARLGGWSTKVEVAGTKGRPIETVDLSRLTDEQLREYGRLAAAAEGMDPDDAIDEDEA